MSPVRPSSRRLCVIALMLLATLAEVKWVISPSAVCSSLHIWMFSPSPPCALWSSASLIVCVKKIHKHFTKRCFVKNFPPSRSASALMGVFCPSDAVEGAVTHRPRPSAAQMVWAGCLLDHHVHAVDRVSGGAVFLMFQPLAEKQTAKLSIRLKVKFH